MAAISGGIHDVEKEDDCYMIYYDTGEKAKLNILNSHVFKFYKSPTGTFPDYPAPVNPQDKAKINCKKVSDYDPKAFQQSTLESTEFKFVIETNKIIINFDKITTTMAIYDKRSDKIVLSESNPLLHADGKALQTLKQNKDEHYFGGGMQNGRFAHKGEIIKIVNSNNWVDGGVTSPCPFYWSTYGYGVLRNTWQPGVYDFGSQSAHEIQTSHKGIDFDAFFFINAQPKDILNDYFELTGKPLFMPEYAFYEAHLNAFNRDYWVKVDSDTPGGILFEDGYYYKSYKPKEMGDKTGILESLNGEKSNYQFSARAVIDRYKLHDMPLGWFIPNDGYGSGYGQTDSLEGDIQNLKEFADYARQNGVEVALWTESQLEPVDTKNPKKGERDLGKEVGVAGVVALKCDVAWIGDGYSFGLNAVEHATEIFVKNTTQKTRPLIIMVDGWAGTQRHSGIWSGDQTGGQWEYIRFHIPTYIGSGLSGQPLIGSDMDGIYGGKLQDVNVRDYQWKTFTPLQLNMDGWGHVPKSPFSFDDQAKSVNRAYLKLKSMLLPYNYTIGHESISGLPMVRGMFLEFPGEPLAYTKDSQYQFMWGPNILVAPIYNDEGTDNDSIRHGIYLPDSNQVWIDFFTGKKYQGGKVYNYLKVPIWKLPVFIRDGAILPMVNPNNNPNEILRDNRIFKLYPNGEASFKVYEDDGITSDYLGGQLATTQVTVVAPETNETGDLFVNINKTVGNYSKIVKDRSTEIQIKASKAPEQIKLAINGQNVELNEVQTDDEFESKTNVYFYKTDFMVNPYLQYLGKQDILQKFLLIKIEKIDVLQSEVQIKIKGFSNEAKIFGRETDTNELLKVPKLTINDKKTAPTAISLAWNSLPDAGYYEIERDGAIFSNLIETAFTFSDFKYNTEHSFRIRSITEKGMSKWSESIHAKTKEDPYKNAVKDVKVSCNFPCQPNQDICMLTDGDLTSLWHTHWGSPGKSDPKKGRILKLHFDLGDAFNIEKIDYVPRDDAGNGTFLKIQYRYSENGKDWSQLSEEIDWDWNNEVKSIALNGVKMRYLELIANDTIGNFGSGKQMTFYKKV